MTLCYFWFVFRRKPVPPSVETVERLPQEAQPVAVAPTDSQIAEKERLLAVEAIVAEAKRKGQVRRLAAQEATRKRVETAKQRVDTAKPGPREGVKARMPADADDFEAVCAEWLRACGVPIDRTAKGPDGGLDVGGPTYGGQCKFHPSQKVGAPDIQQLAGAAKQFGKSQKIFFHYGPGYTDAAVVAARQLRVALWKLDPDKRTFRRVQ